MNSSSRDNGSQPARISASEIIAGLKRNHVLAIVGIVLACVSIVFSCFVFVWFYCFKSEDDSGLVNVSGFVSFSDDSSSYSYDFIVLTFRGDYPSYVDVYSSRLISDPNVYDFCVGDYLFECRSIYLGSFSNYMSLTLSSDSYVYFYGYTYSDSVDVCVRFFDCVNEMYSDDDALYYFDVGSYYGYCGGFVPAGSYVVTPSVSERAGFYFPYMIVLTLV